MQIMLYPDPDKLLNQRCDIIVRCKAKLAIVVEGDPKAPLSIATTSWCRLIGLVGREFANGPGDQGSIPGRVIPKT